MLVDVTSWLSVTTFLTLSIVVLVTSRVWKALQKAWTFKRLGIPAPPAIPFLLHTHVFLKEGFLQSILKWTRQYPKIYGCFINTRPSIVVSDLDLVRDVLVKKFGLFANRSPSQALNYKPWSENLLMLRDDHWKHVRSQLSPTFSSGKLKKMTATIERVVKNLYGHVKSKAESGQEVELKALCRSYAIDVIAGVAFGLQVDSLTDPSHPFITHGTNFTSVSRVLRTISMVFPFLTPVLQNFGITFPPMSANRFFMDVLDFSLKERRQDADKNHADFLQLLVEAEREGAAQGQVDAEIDHGHHLVTSRQWSRKGLTKDEMYGNTLVFLFAGNDTLSTIMSFTLFCLAAHPECLTKAQAEVDDKLGKKPVNYEIANELTYIDMCMNEAIRIFPPGFILDRQSSEDTEVGGYHVTKGMSIVIPAISIHRDPAIWPDPMKYDPERHSPEGRASRHAYAFLPFGLGPRNCIGMRLAQLEVRMALATLLQHFSPRLCGRTVYPPKLKKTTLEAEDGLWVKFHARA